MSQEYEPTNLVLFPNADGTYHDAFACDVDADEGLSQGHTTFDGTTRIQRWNVVSPGAGGQQELNSTPYQRQAGEKQVQVEVYKDGTKKGSETVRYPD